MKRIKKWYVLGTDSAGYWLIEEEGKAYWTQRVVGKHKDKTEAERIAAEHNTGRKK